MLGAAASTAHLLPEPPFFGPWRPAPVAAVLAGAAAAYVVGMARLATRHRRWPRRRAVAFLTGLALVGVATGSGLASYDEVSFSADVVQHVLVGMAAPALLVLGAPMTLALQAARRPLQQRLVRVLRSWPAHGVTHPVLAWSVFVGSLFVVYLSPLYALSLRNPLVHQVVHAHFLLAGVLFFWLVMARDPARRSLSAPARLAMVGMAIPFHALLATAILSSSRPLGGGAGPGRLADQRLGAAILLAGGEVVAVAVGLAVVAQWIRQDERAAAREDRAQAADGAPPGGVVPAGPGASFSPFSE